LGTDGKLARVPVLGAASPALRQAAIQDATEWGLSRPLAMERRSA
jgi:hypothetical protein